MNELLLHYVTHIDAAGAVALFPINLTFHYTGFPNLDNMTLM